MLHYIILFFSMKSALWFFSLTLLILLSIAAGFWLFSPAFSQEKEVVSPLPPSLTLEKNAEVRLLDFWKPLLSRLQGSEALAPTAKAALLVDLDSGETLYEREATTRLPMASLTKIMTAIVALEHPLPNNNYTVLEEHLVGENSMGVTPGEVLTLEELLYGLLLPSGNDAAEVLAGNYSGGRSEFIHAMNQKAAALDLHDTNFTNPSGLQGDGDQYTTASDLASITKYALEHFPLFQKVVATFSHTIDQTPEHNAYYLENETNLLTSYPGVKGVKTGYTPEAGLCLVTYLDYDGHHLVGVILGSENRRAEMKDMLDYGLEKLGTTPPPHD